MAGAVADASPLLAVVGRAYPQHGAVNDQILHFPPDPSCDCWTSWWCKPNTTTLCFLFPTSIHLLAIQHSQHSAANMTLINGSTPDKKRKFDWLGEQKGRHLQVCAVPSCSVPGKTLTT